MTSAYAQVSFSIIEPASIAGGYEFTSNGDGTNWGLPNLLDPNDAVMDTVVLVDDGTPGLNAQGVPFANEGCNTLLNDLTGKIAMVYRYDGVSSNVCWYGTKVLMAEQAGAIGVIMVNREDALIDVPGTTDGPLTTIPFAFISKSDGAIIRQKIDNGEDVVAFIGNKLGLYGNDVGIVKSQTLGPNETATASYTSQNASEYGFDVGAQIYNYGTTAQNNVSITATVQGPGGAWTETAGPYSIPVGDSIDVYTGGTNNINAFSLANYPTGKYTLTYNVDIGGTDEAQFDNTLKYHFYVSDSILSYAPLDSLTLLPKASANYRPASSNSCVICQAYQNSNGSRVAVDGIYFSSVTGYQSGVSLEGEEMILSIYEWNDVFTDLNDVNLDFADLYLLGFGAYYYPSDLQGQSVLGQLEYPVQLADNQRFLACVETTNTEVYMGYDTRLDYTRNVDHYLQPMVPISSDAGWAAIGFGTDITPAIAVHVFDANELSTGEIETTKISIQPNPANDLIIVGFETLNSGNIKVTDIAGKVVLEQMVTKQQSIVLNVTSLEPGQYLVQWQDETGNAGTSKFVKQ